MADPRLEEMIVVIREAFYQKSVPQCHSFGEEAVWVEFCSCQWNMEGMMVIQLFEHNKVGLSCKGLSWWG